MSTNMSLNSTTPPAQLSMPNKTFLCSLPIEKPYIFHTTFLIFILLVTFIGNVLVILAVIFFRRLRTITNYFVVSLAVSDLMVAVVSLPFRIDQTMHNMMWCLGLELCKTWIVTDVTFSFASIWNLAIISIDRYIAIVHPFRYHSWITPRVGYGLIAYAWGLSFFLAILGLFNWTDFNKQQFIIARSCSNIDKNYYTVSAAVAFFLPLAIVLVMYTGVFRVALNQAKAMAALQIDSHRRGRRSSINLVREVKAAKTLAIVVGCFVVCWLPMAIITQVNIWNRPVIQKLSRNVKDALSLTFLYVLPAINSTLNPIIYALFNRDFRSAFIKLVRRICGERLGAVGFGESTAMTGTTMSTNGKINGDRSRGIRFKERASSSSEAPPTIPMRDPDIMYNNGCNDASKAPENSLVITNDSHSTETTLDDERRKTSAKDCGIVVTSDLNREDRTEGSSKMTTKLPPLEKDLSKSSEDDVAGLKMVKPFSLPPIAPSASSEPSHESLTRRSLSKEDL